MNENTTPEKNLTRKQRRAIAVWMKAGTVADVAELCDVNPSTVFRWKKEPAFREALRELQSATLDNATAQLVSEQSKSITVLAKLRDSGDTPPSVRRGSARDLLELSQKFIELADIEARLSTLEERIS